MSGTAIARGCDRLLDAAVVLLATWTPVYHVCLAAGIGSDTALGVEAVLLLAAAVAYAALRGRAHPGGVTHPIRDHRGGLSAQVAVAAALVAGLGMAFSAPWFLIWIGWLVAAAAGTAYAATMLRRERGVPDEVTSSRGEATLAVAAAIALGVFATFSLHPNPDDLFYVNLSQWVATNGTFPLRDTLYSNLGYPLANWPPAASYDAGTGAIAHVLGLHAGTIVYVVVPPLMTVLSVLALWRLLRNWRVPHVSIALVAALVFLLVDGTQSYGPPGNLWLTRLWQGKVILLAVLVPVILVHLLRYAERPTRAKAAWLFACGTAAVGLTTTAIFLVPIAALAGVAPLLVRRETKAAVLGFVATAAYPLGTGAFTVLTGGRSADDFGIRRQFRFDPEWFGHAVFLTGLLAVLAVTAVLVGALLVPHPLARVTTGTAVLLTGITFFPGFTRLSYDIVGLGPTLWRVTWVCTVAALVGVLASWAADRVEPSTRVVGSVLAVALLAVFGHPIFTATSGASLAWPPHWQRGPGSQAMTDWILAHTQPGNIVLAPDGLSITVVVTTTEVKVVAPRDYYLDYLSGNASFHYEARRNLSWMVNSTPGWLPDEVPDDLRTLNVKVACVYRTDAASAVLLRATGYVEAHLTSTYRCFVPSADGLTQP